MVTQARVGVVGAGWWSTRVHLPSLAQYDRAELVGVADLDFNRATQAAERFGGRPFESLAAMLDHGVDAVVVATTHGTHYELAREALSAGKDVMVEKPMVVNPDHGFELVALAEKNGCRLHVGYPYPHSAHALRARDVILGGEIGNLHLISSMFATLAGLLLHDAARFEAPDDALVGPDPATYRQIGTGGQARGQLTHSLSAMLFITGVELTEVAGFTYGTGLEVDMVDAASFRTSAGAIGTMATTGSVPMGVETMERLEVYGSTGHVQFGMSEGTLALHLLSGRVDVNRLEGLARYPEHKTSRHLFDCFLDNRVPLVDGYLGAVTALVIDRLLDSAKDGSPRQIRLEERKTT